MSYQSRQATAHDLPVATILCVKYKGHIVFFNILLFLGGNWSQTTQERSGESSGKIE